MKASILDVLGLAIPQSSTEKYDHVTFEEEALIMSTLLEVVFNQSFL